jgi:hypothetical protein
MFNIKKSKPLFFEHSVVPKILSIFAPITIGAITIGPFVFSRGEMDVITRRHETIHWQQYIELGIIGFPILYFIYWLIGLAKYRDGAIAYVQIPFEQEAYDNDNDENYLLKRRRYNWIGFKI